MKIRDAIEADLPAIVDIYNATVPTRMVTAELEPVSVESRVPWFRVHAPDIYPLWIMEMNDQIAGWLSFQEFIPRSAYRGTSEVSVYVGEKFRRIGIGRRLLERAIARSPGLGLRTLVGLIFAHNEPSLRLFGQLGFQRWGLLPRVARLDGAERDLTIVGRHLSPGLTTESNLFLVADDEMDHSCRIGDPEAIKVFPQLFDFVALRNAIDF